MARKWEDWQIATIAGIASVVLGLAISIPLGWMVYQRYVRGDFSNGRPTVVVIGL